MVLGHGLDILLVPRNVQGSGLAPNLKKKKKACSCPFLEGSRHCDFQSGHKEVEGGDRNKGKGLFRLHFHNTVHHERKSGQEFK